MTWNRMLEKIIRCRKIKERTDMKDRTRREDREKGHEELKWRNSVQGDTSASTRRSWSACGDWMWRSTHGMEEQPC